MHKRPSIYVGIGALIFAAAIIGGVFFLSQQHAASIPDSSSADAFAVVDSSTSTPPSITSASAKQPPNTKKYQSAAYHFSIYYPDDLTATEQPGAASSTVVLFQHQATGQGFDIFIAPYTQPKITQARFLMDEPSGVMNDPQNITIDGAPATEFFSTNPAMGASREIWFLYPEPGRGVPSFLYEVTAAQPQASWLLQIMQTWRWT